MGAGGKRRARASSSPAKVTALVLAAGSSSRMGRPKALVPVLGQPLLARVLDTVRRLRPAETVVVLGSESDRIRKGIDLRDTTVVVNPDFEEGMSSSLRIGAAAAAPSSRPMLIVLGDQPFVAPATLEALIERHASGSAKILIPTFEGVRGNPILLDRVILPELDSLRGDIGCRGIFPGHTSDLVEVPVRDPGILIDVDTPAEVAQLERALEGHPEPTAGALRPLVAERVAVHRKGPVRSLSHVRILPNVLALAIQLENAREPFALATVVSVRPPTSGKPGFKAIVRPTGEVTGWVGGSCTGRVLVAEALQSMEDGLPRLVRLSPDVEDGATAPAGIVTRRLECESGGTMEIYVEPHLPEPELLVVGEAPVAKALAALGGFLGYRVTIVAPGARPSDFPDGVRWAPELERLPEVVTPGTFAVIASTGMYDESALKMILPKMPRYVALVSSRRRGKAVVDSLRSEGLADAWLKQIRNPAGLDIAARDPEEIALSIFSEITKVRRSEPTPLASKGPARPVSTAPPSIDPICGMEVEAASPLRTTYKGVVYRFCSDGCLAKFRRSPAKFTAA
ncbi:MAG: NTP transferase domain-containing protein [Thermoplasmata archaeon]|nr:NTP transferase domain-containing protein [Thermoplasmata archaeon]